ncbi:50S ribosomal protein L35 [Fructilactobacillus lindneri]|nr:50S ribosomal protein L35 [Fructilactobacillus lindneri]ANZ58268.1 50S ribosomal protein L35 [Fructilactobacillus lindneri]ANZ59590.1 50S ribosomal protein L35 [Fructilactobacillus lindneri]POG98626.1 50S ribosomal protein L35 [Fructilactobacillus lindneri]POH04014.1 50S ribosomal protein L35 [Fructilactobacillus lindneri]POH04744.1 50S ribosomal protein L35 [Fructilactobacillus lindneri]
MPKMKSNRAVAKRFKKTSKGGLKSAHAFTDHRFHGKTKKQRRHLRGTHTLSKIWVKTYTELLRK